MMAFYAIVAAAANGAAANGAVHVLHGMRTDGAPVYAGSYSYEQFRADTSESYPFKPFSDSAVKKALSTEVDWVKKGAVTPAKDQGAHGYCGTFGRVAAAEGQYALRSPSSYGGLRNFSEQELVSCIGWDKDQFSFFAPNGFMDSADFPYNTTGPDMDPPVPYNPCRGPFKPAKVIEGTANHNFTNSTGSAPDEKQLATFLHKNGPVQTGVASHVFGLRVKGCEATNDCFITQDMCNDPSVKGKPIDHSVTLVGYGNDKTHGEYWLVKNSWSTKFANAGFIKVARGISCAHIDCCGNVFTYGDPATYYE